MFHALTVLFVCVEANRGFGSHGLPLALKTGVLFQLCFYGNGCWKRQIHSVLNSFNSYLLPPSTVALEKKKKSNPKADPCRNIWFLHKAYTSSFSHYFAVIGITTIRVRGGLRVRGHPAL